MRIIKNEGLLKRQTDNFIRGELSNVAAAVQTPVILVDYYQVDLDRTTLLKGYRNAEDYIGPTSTVVYKHIAKVPMVGIDNLVSQASFDEELGFEENFSQSGAIFPNTIIPKPYDCFMIPDSPVKALYMVSNINPATVRSNPFTEITFNLYTRNPEIIQHLLDQVKDELVTTVTAIGTDRSLVVHKDSYFKIEENIRNYLEIADLYTSLFYDENKAAFSFDGLPGLDGGGCLGYQTDCDLNGSISEDMACDPENPLYPYLSQVKNPMQGESINDQGDRLYIIDGEPIVVSSHYPYWFVRNYTDHYGNANEYPGANRVEPDCASCCNPHCSNSKNFHCDCSAMNAVPPEWTEYLKDSVSESDIVRQAFIDITMWKMMFTEGIITYDPIITFANNNFQRSVPRVYTDSPDLYLDEHLYHNSVLYRMIERNPKRNPFQYIHPQSEEGDPRITKFIGKHIYYLRYYGAQRDAKLNCGFYNIWDKEFQLRIQKCELYPDQEEVPACFSEDGSASYTYRKWYPFNVSLRNAIILGYNRKPVDWDNLEIEHAVNLENYILLPILLYYYKEYINELQK